MTIRRHLPLLAALCVLCATLAQADPPQVMQMTVRPDSEALIRRFVDRGVEKLDIEHDISGARLLLRSAAEGGNAVAARRLAQTYDPAWLAKQNVVGWEGLMDPEKAFRWYKEAAELGDKDPSNRFVQGEAK